MNISNLIVIPALVISIAGASASYAQSKEETSGEVSGFRAQAGLANFTQGEVQCVCAGQKQSAVSAGQEFASGDSIETGSDGLAEILLSPGSYLRLSGNTQAVLMDLSSGNLKIKLLRGSAIVEMVIASGLHSGTFISHVIYIPITVITPREEYSVVKGGAYYFHVDGESSSSVKVLKGLAVVAGSDVADGKEATVSDGRVKLSLAEETSMDKFDHWSRERSAALVEANKALRKADWFKKLRKDRVYNQVRNSDGAVEASIRHTISARNGYVVFVESAEVKNPGESAWQELKAGDSLASGASVRTVAACRAQLQPFPSVDLYLGSDTEILYAEKEEGQVAVTLVKGAVIVIAHPEGKAKEPAELTLITGTSQYETSVKGRFRLNLFEPESELLVYEGSIKAAGTVIKAPKRVFRVGADERVVQLDEKGKDSFDIWSNRRMMLPALASLKGYLGPQGGLWLLSQATGEYTFVSASREYRSPYGGSYETTYMSVDDILRQFRFPPFLDPERVFRVNF